MVRRNTHTVIYSLSQLGRQQQEPGVSQPFKKVADSFHPHSESRAREEEMGISSPTSKSTLGDTFLCKTLLPKGYITF